MTEMLLQFDAPIPENGRWSWSAFFAAQLFAPRIPPGRTLGRYPRLCGLLMTTGYSDVKVQKTTPSPVGHEKREL